MNLDLDREQARRRRLIQRSLAHQQQRHRHEVRSGILPPTSVLPHALTVSASRNAPMNGRLPDAPSATLLVQLGIWTLIVAIGVQHHEALLAFIRQLAGVGA